MPRTRVSTTTSNVTSNEKPQKTHSANKWSADEHDRYLTALELYPNRSWKLVAEFVGTRTVRQVMSHAQKLPQKQQRHSRGLKPAGRPRRAAPESPTSVEVTPLRHRLHQRQPSHIKGTEARPEESSSCGELRDDVIIIMDEDAGDLLKAFNCAEDALIKTENVRNRAGHVDTQWSQADYEWIAELMRSNVI